MKLGLHIERWQARVPLRITGHVFDYFESVVVELGDRGKVGYGEGLGIFYHGETPESIVQQIESIGDHIEAGIDRAMLQELLPHGGARHAVDQALWDLEAKLTGRSIWDLTGIRQKPIQSGMTIGIESSPEAMAARATAATGFRTLKIKLDAEQSIERVRAVREARPDVALHVDANQGWSIEQLHELTPALAELGVVMIEQPLRQGNDSELEGYESLIPLCADESCIHLGDLGQVARRYQMINIKLDKAGGLTHALELASAARERGLGLMVGCMGGTSLAMAPAYVLACVSDLVDIDGPLWLKTDRCNGMAYNGSDVSPFGPALWG